MYGSEKVNDFFSENSKNLYYKTQTVQILHIMIDGRMRHKFWII